MTETEIKNIFPEELKIDPEKGFDEHDIFGWKQQGEGLIDLLNSTNQQMVLGLDSPWGSGKTTFLQMLAGELKNTNGENSVVYFDAFEVDYMDDPFIALAGELAAHIENLTSIDEKIKDKFTSKATQVGKVLAKEALKISVKAATLNSIDIDGVEEDIANEIAKSASSILEQQVESSIKAYKEKKAAVNALKSSLSEIAGDLTEGDKSLIFIIDELDRCRPDFALRILEQIKHLFSTPNVHFILSADFKQLGAMVKNAYGNEYDSEKYFHKFRDLTISLEHRDPVLNYLKKYCSETLLNNCTHDDSSFFNIYLERLHDIYGFSLRDLQKVLNTISVNHKKTKNNETNDAVYIALVSMKIMKPELFFKAKSGGLKLDDIYKFYALGEVDLDKEIHSIIVAWVSGHFNLYQDEETLENNSFVSRAYEQAQIKHRNNEKQIIDMCNQLSSC